jgi:glycosyltransferase involved in cell wall biosynthesis
MRILHILNHIEIFGNGIVNMAVDLAGSQAKDNHQVGVASLGGEYEVLLASYGIQHFAINQEDRTPINLLKASKRYRDIIQEFQPDIVHAHMMTGVVLARALRGKARYKLVSTVHNEFQRSAVLMGLADRTIAVSKAVRERMVERGIPQQKLRVVQNGTIGSPRTCQIADYQPIQLQRPAIATVAGMYTRKGIAELIDAFVEIAADFPQAHLYLIGDGPDRSQFEAQAQSTSVADRIHFEGFQSEPQRYLLSTDIFVLASHRDPSPLVVPEAREAGCAIVATAVDGIPEALEGGQAGILTPPQDSHSLAAALAQLLSDPEQLCDWKERAKQNLEWLNFTRVHQQTLAVYRELLNQKSESQKSKVKSQKPTYHNI